MSSAEDVEEPQQAVTTEQVKRKKKQRACDFCRRKKIRCDGAEMPEHRCSRCIGQGIDCTYEPINTRPPSKSYVQILESRLQNMERLFSQLHPDVHIPKNFDGTLDSGQLQIPSETFHPIPSPHHPPSSTSAGFSPPPPDSPPAEEADLDPSDDEREARYQVMESLRKVTAPADPRRLRYHGKSSNLMFLQTVMETKERSLGIGRPKSAEPDTRNGRASERPESSFAAPQWLSSLQAGERPPYREFPPPDLMPVLFHSYFYHFNAYMPLLHEPTFNQRVAEGLHLRDQAFGAVVLLVCANGARMVEDPRVAEEGDRPAGWKWFAQVETSRWSLLSRPRLEDLQSCALISTYLSSSYSPQGTWTIIGLGIRMAQDLGIHRKKMYGPKPTVEDELWKRAFWMLVLLDRISSFNLGRPCAIHDEDFDVGLPEEVDDEYWLNPDPEQAFKQPEGKPSKIAFVNCFIRLYKILAFASRTIYSINKSKLAHGYVGPEWEQRIVAELDSALNKWIDTVPEHLRWDPNRQDRLFMNQSATLYANYYLLQICVHRPFIPTHRKQSRIPFPSLTICTNAARSCTHVLDIQHQRTGEPLLFNRVPLFTSGLVLLLNMWGGKRSGLSSQVNMADVYKSMSMLKELEQHTYSAKRLWDILNNLLSIGELSLPSDGKFDIDALFEKWAASNATQSSAMAPSTRGNGASQPTSANPMLSSLYSSDSQSAATPSSSSAFVSAPYMPPDVRMGMRTGTSGMAETSSSFALPIHTKELGRLPFHHGFRSPFPVLNPQQQQQLQAVLFQDVGQPAHAAHPGPAQLEALIASAGVGLSAASAGNDTGFGGSADFPMRVKDYSELLAALSAPSPQSVQSHGQSPGHGQMQHGQQQVQGMTPPQMGGGSMDAFGEGMMDVTMSAAENMMFTDNMMEMWSTAPMSLEWDDWGAYLNAMTGMEMTGNNMFNPPPPSGL